MSNDENKQDIFKKNVSGIDVEVRDPIQDIMSEQEIDDASARLESLLTGEDDEA